MNGIDFDVECAHCKESLKGLALGEVCRKCGQPVGATIDLRLIEPVEMTVKADRPCGGCGYNLRSLGVGAICPECAKPVAGSLQPNELWLANRDWLSGVRKGVKMLLISSIGIPAISISLWLVGVWVSSDVVSSLSNVFGGLGLLVLALLGIVGVVNAASREANRHPSDGSQWPHRLAGATAFLPIVLIAGAMILSLIMVMATGAVYPMMSILLLFLLLGSFSACPICTAICLRRVARRGPRQSLAKATTVWIWIAVFMAPLVFAQFVAIFIGGSSSSAAWVFVILGIVSIAFFVGCLLLYFMGIFGLLAYKKMLKEALAQLKLPVAVPVPGGPESVSPPAPVAVEEPHGT